MPADPRSQPAASDKETIGKIQLTISLACSEQAPNPCLARVWHGGGTPTPCTGSARGVGDRNEPRAWSPRFRLGEIVWLRQHMPRVPLVLLIDHDDLDDIVEAMAQGVRGFITTSMELSEAGAAIQCVAAGGTFVPASILIRFAQDRQNGSKCVPSEDSKELFESLTPRERDVVALLRQGKSNKALPANSASARARSKCSSGAFWASCTPPTARNSLSSRAPSLLVRNPTDPTSPDNAWHVPARDATVGHVNRRRGTAGTPRAGAAHPGYRRGSR